MSDRDDPRKKNRTARPQLPTRSCRLESAVARAMIAATLMVLLAGLAIGATGIGGILVVPVLTGLGGHAVLESIAASSCAFLFTGIVAFWRQRRSAESAPWGVYGAALAGALAGARLRQW